jgi:hypothetical protein
MQHLVYLYAKTIHKIKEVIKDAGIQNPEDGLICK